MALVQTLNKEVEEINQTILENVKRKKLIILKIKTLKVELV